MKPNCYIPGIPQTKTTSKTSKSSAKSKNIACITDKCPCIREIPANDYGSYYKSEKFSCILQLICKWLCSGEKVTIFSNSVKTLDMLAQHIKTTYLRIDGSVSILQRAQITSLFNNGVSNILFASTKCVSEGITLTSCDKVILVNCSWNPASDAQCIARTHRLGCTKPCSVYTMMANNSMEGYVLQTQHRKKAIADAVLQGSSSNKSHQSHLNHGLPFYLRYFIDPNPTPLPIQFSSPLTSFSSSSSHKSTQLNPSQFIQLGQHEPSTQFQSQKRKNAPINTKNNQTPFLHDNQNEKDLTEGGNNDHNINKQKFDIDGNNESDLRTKVNQTIKRSKINTNEPVPSRNN
jgi:superfamily II DNA/RNA helicase